jgi:hypothetical protein
MVNHILKLNTDYHQYTMDSYEETLRFALTDLRKTIASKITDQELVNELNNTLARVGPSTDYQRGMARAVEIWTSNAPAPPVISYFRAHDMEHLLLLSSRYIIARMLGVSNRIKIDHKNAIYRTFGVKDKVLRVDPPNYRSRPSAQAAAAPGENYIQTYIEDFIKRNPETQL